MCQSEVRRRGLQLSLELKPSFSLFKGYSSRISLESFSKTKIRKFLYVTCSHIHLKKRMGLLQLAEILINLLVLICASATQSASAGFSSLGGFGSATYYSMGYSMSGFLGDEVNQVTQLDVQYSRMKLPTIYAAAAISLLLLTLTLSCLVASCMSGTTHNKKLLLMEEVISVLSAVTYIICVALYIHFIKQINATEVCKQRQALYHRRGYTSVTCDIMGTEMAVCVFAVILVGLYIASAVLVGLILRKMKTNTDTPNTESFNKTGEHDSELQNFTSNKPRENISNGIFI
ncbi:MARVEL domain-containing protein 3-like [Dendrobates tinctorius]|uniref:MARVEL domain-containing protein 3-like n=1 Tax=Dendrobates tinctorius TaxID=92724 RepID=UPI003CC9FFCE